MILLHKIIRGAGYLPHVGSHPGTLILILMILAPGAAGIQNGGLLGFGLGVLLGAVVYVPFYAAGCVSRSNLSDRICAKNASDETEVAA